MLQVMLFTLTMVWVLDGVALLANPRGVITMLKEFVDKGGGVQRWWAVASGLGLALFWLPMTFPYQPLWMAVGFAMVVKGLFLGLAPDRWRDPLIAWCLSREDVDYRFWGLGLCALAILMGHSLNTFVVH